MKEFLGYELMAAMGIPTPRACFVDLWVNDTHLGVYTQVEAVDAPSSQDYFDDGNGNLYKPEVAGRPVGLDRGGRRRAGGSRRPSAPGATGLRRPPTTTESFNVGGGDLEEIIERLGEDAGWIPGRLETTEDT